MDNLSIPEDVYFGIQMAFHLSEIVFGMMVVIIGINAFTYISARSLGRK